MKLFLNAGFSNLIGSEDCQLIKSLGFDGVRQNLSREADNEALINELRDEGLVPIFLFNELDPAKVAEWAALIRDAHFPLVYMEVINEPDRTWAADLHQRSGPVGWGRHVRNCYDAIKGIDPSIRVVSGGITTTDAKRLAFLAQAVPFFPLDVVIGYHSYRTTSTAHEPVGGFTTRAEEFNALKIVGGGRRILNTEVGWHTIKSNKPKKGLLGWLGFTDPVQFTDSQVAAFAKTELAYHTLFGSEGVTWYQFNDGPSPTWSEDHFGIRRIDKSLKPVAEVFKK